MGIRRLVVVLGDQLDRTSAAFENFDPARDCIWMAEVAEESTHVPSHKARIVLFLSAMRHFRNTMRARGWRVMYRELDDPANRGTLAEELSVAVETLWPEEVLAVEPGDYRVRQSLLDCCPELRFVEDRHFLCTPAEFADHARERKQLRMEFFYRHMRRKHRVLMDGDQPCGGGWNFDSDNRKSFGRQGPGEITVPASFPPDELTREVMALVEERFPTHPGSLRHFDWPVTRERAQSALRDFIQHRLPRFGAHQDAMWQDEPFLFHSRLSAALNLKLLHPREVIQAAEGAYHDGRAPLASVEGFIRQILGWREFARGIYWHFMPQYGERNALLAAEPLPDFYWTGETEMHCLRQCIGQTLEYGYAHHIQRLMVTGLYALLLGVHPRHVHEWYLAVYVDAIEWVELPNTIGMSQYADGGVMASKPYVASGGYIQRMSNYCEGCRYHPAEATGADACPFTTLYWDFLLRHRERLAANPRMTMQLRNAGNMGEDRHRLIRQQAAALRSKKV